MTKLTYELWDVETANLADSFTTEAEALEAVRKAVDDLGPKIVRYWALASKDLIPSPVASAMNPGRTAVRPAQMRHNPAGLVSGGAALRPLPAGLG